MNRKEAKERAEELVGKMSISEKISQLRYNAPAIDRLGIPAYNWWGEALHGVARAGQATSFPQAIGMAAAFDTELIGKIAGVIATEGRAKYNAYSAHGDRDIYKGLTFWSPNINIFRDPRWGRGQETYGEDPYLSGTLGTAFVKGLQGDGEYMKAAACAKHFAVHSGPEAIRHEFDAKASAKDLRETYLPAFERLVKDAGVEAVMGAYNRVNGEPACANRPLMEGVLRGEWGFEGHYVSDCWAIVDFHEHHHVTETPAESAALAMNTGCDLNCGSTFEYLMEAYEKGLVREERLTEACVRLFTARYLLGLFDETEYDDIPYSVVECPEHLKLAEQCARESIVLLKNNGILPLQKEKIHTLGVIGPNANSRAALVGNYHGTAAEYITPLDGILRKFGEDMRILYSEGSDIQNDRVEHLAFENDRLSEAEIVAEESDAVVLVVGLNETLEGEEGDTGNSYASGDKTDLLLPKPQESLMRTLAATGKPVILVLIAGSAIDLSFADTHFDAVLQMWYPGARGGKALAEILSGETSPSGKLPVTFPHNDDPLPAFTDYSMKGRTYRYLEHEPLYPFGYGLTYGDVCVTEAEYFENASGEADPSASGHTEAEEKNSFFVKAHCKNSSPRATDDVVQVYVECPESADAPLHPRLAGFARVHLEAGGTADVSIPLDPLTFTVIDERGNRVSGGRKFRLHVGTSQPDARSRELTGHAPYVVEVCRG
jgi:beta-glucosidase